MRTHAWICAWIVACSAGMSSSAAEKVDASFLEGDMESMQQFWTDKARDDKLDITATVAFPKAMEGVPEPIASRYSEKRYAFFVFSPHCLLVLSRDKFSRFLKENPELTGRVCEIRGEFRRDNIGRDAQGAAQWGFSWRADDIVLVSPPDPVRDWAEFKPRSYLAMRDVQRLLKDPDYWRQRPCQLVVSFDKIAVVGADLETALGLKSGRWGRIYHATEGDMPRLFLPATAIFDADALRALKAGSELYVYGRVFSYLEGKTQCVGMVVDAAASEAISEEHPLLKAKAAQLPGPESYRRVPKPGIIRETLAGIHTGTLYRETKNRIEIALVYRGHAPVAADVRGHLGAAVKPGAIQLRIDNNGFREEIPIVLLDPADPAAQALGTIEKDDTIVLLGRVERCGADGYCLVVDQVIVPPIQ